MLPLAKVRYRKYKLTIKALGGETLEITELRINFEVKRNTFTDPDRAEILIYNLTKEHRKALRKDFNFIREPGHGVILEAGYNDGIGVIFDGEAYHAYSKKRGENWETVLKCGVAYHTFLNKSHGISSVEGMSLKSVLKQIEKKTDMKMSIAKWAVAEIKKLFPNGFSDFGTIKKLFSGLAKDFGLDISAKDKDTIEITKAGYPNDDHPVKFDHLTGLVGTPEITRKGVNFTAILTHQLKKSSPINLYSETTEYDGTVFTAFRVVHRGDNWGERWVTEVEAFFYPPKGVV